MNKSYWLLKTEGSCYSIDDLKRDQKTDWTGIRNYQARDFLRAMKAGDLVLIYRPLTLNQIKQQKSLDSMKITQKGSRLSVSPVSLQEYNFIVNT
jgi:predicted RNA-binding protein with PUA-like domain